jgi:periplasmic copper chaperone A
MELRSHTCVGIAAIAVAVALALAGPAAAHVFPMPTYVPTGSSSRIELSVPNERRVRMTGFELQVPTDVVVANARPTDGWTTATTGRRATWTDGDLSPYATETFALELDIAAAPGTIVLDAVERFDDGERVRWPVSLVVTPADEPSQRLGVALIVGVGGLLALTIGVAYLWRRTSRPLQEK